MMADGRVRWSSAPTAARGWRGFGGSAGGRLLPFAVALAIEDELVGGGLEPVDRGLGEERVGHHGEPLDRLAVGRYDGGRLTVAFSDRLVDVGGASGGGRA